MTKYACAALVAFAGSASAVTVTEDFDSFASLANGQAVGNGASPASFFFDLTVTKRNGSGLDGVIFDSTISGPNDPSDDPDLLIDNGNVLTAQEGSDGTAAPGDIFSDPDDNVGFILILDFIVPVAVESLLLVDINGGTFTEITLTDENGLQRQYDIPAEFTGEVPDDPGEFLMSLVTTAPQASPHTSGPIVVDFEDLGFDQTAVVSLEFDTRGSAAIDDITLTGDQIPTPGTMALLGLGAFAGLRRRR
ncbi:MAG: PEP-CTERM sorting domain-containing protein [Planctomycetota bacterium]